MRAPMGFAVAACLLVSSCSTQPTVDSVRAQFAGTFKNMPVEKVAPSEIDGLYEIYSGGRLIYFAPKPNLVVFGELWTTAGESVSQKKAAAYVAQRVLEVPADVGVRIGDGPVEVVGFLDPDCGHCMQAHDWFEQRDFRGMTLRAIFLPLQPGTPAFARAQQLVCAPAALKREALRQMYAHENPPGNRFLSCDGATDQLAKQGEISKELGISGTPTFLVQGQTVLGFDQARLESLLPQSTSTLKE